MAMGGSDSGEMKEDLEVLGIEDTSAADDFSKIAIATRIVPSQKREGNLDVLTM